MLKHMFICAGLAFPIAPGVAAVTSVSQPGSGVAGSGAVSVDRYVAVHVTEGVPVRSGGATIYYPIAFPKPGDLLVVDGETSGWLRVGYPAGVRPFVSAEDVDLISPGVVRLNKPGKLRAPNANSGLKGAFQPVVESPLSAGTDLSGAEAIKDDDGKIVAYVVDAPAAARGWISRDAVRRATDAEAADLLAKLKPSEPATAVPAPATAPSPASVTTPSPAVVPAAEPPANPVVPPAETSPSTAPVVIPTIAPAPSPVPAAPVAAPVATPPGMEIPSTVPVGDKDGGGAAPAATTLTSQLLPAASSVDELKALYDRVRAQPLETAELDVAIAQFERYRATLGSTPRDAAIARQIDAYAQAMKIRRDLRNLQTQNAAAVSGSELLKTDLGKRVIELERQRIYTVLGRLVRSTVYDGDRAPVLYRVMSPEPGSARTLGYLLPDAKFDYVNKLGQVVGIIGQLRPDEAMRTNLIIPSRVDVVSLAPIVVSPDIPGLAVPAPGTAPTPASAPAPASPAPAVDPASMPKLPSQAAPGAIPPGSAPEKP